MKKQISLILLLGMLLASCTSDSTSDLLEPISEEETINYETHIKPIMNTNCVGCHSNPPQNGAPMALTTYNSVKNAVENQELIERLISTQPGYMMPIGGQNLPQNLIDIIIQWEADGFLEQ